MKRLLTNVNYWFDYVVGYMMTNPRKKDRYHRYMYTKWGKRYCSREEFDRYWEEEGIF